MLRLPLAEVTKADLDALVADQTPEGRNLDFKRDLKLDTDGDKKELAKDVSSFANAAGGFLVYGAEEAKDPVTNNGLGFLARLIGVECSSWDALRLRLENVLRDRLDPRVPGISFHKVDGYERGPVVIAYVPKSWVGPHMVAFGQTHFYSRNSSGVHPLDVREIGQAFRVGSEQAEALRRFRDGRVATVLAGQTPVPLWGTDAKLIVHACPLEPYAAESAKDFGNPARMPPINSGTGWNDRHNLDGYVTYAGPAQGPQRSYSLAFRNGAFEGVTLVERHPDKDWVSGQPLQNSISTAVKLFNAISRERGYEGPVSIMVALVGVYGARLIWDVNSEHFHDDHRIDRANVILPDVLIEDRSADLDKTLAPLLDALWQSSGWPSSPQ